MFTKTIVIYLIAICFSVIFLKTIYAEKWIFDKVKVTYFRLCLLQIVGYALLFLAVYASYKMTGQKIEVYVNTPILETIFFTFILLPLIVGLVKGKKLVLLTPFLSLGIHYLVLNINTEYLYFKRKHRFDNKEKIETIVEVDLPNYEVIDYEERFGENVGYKICLLKIKFLSPLEQGTIDKVSNWEIREDEYRHNYGDFTLWVNKDFVHAIIIYNDFSKEYFLPPY